MGSPFPSNANGAGNVPLATLSAEPGFPRDSGSPCRQHVSRPCLLDFPCFRCCRVCAPGGPGLQYYVTFVARDKYGRMDGLCPGQLAGATPRVCTDIAFTGG